LTKDNKKDNLNKRHQTHPKAPTAPDANKKAHATTVSTQFKTVAQIVSVTTCAVNVAANADAVQNVVGG
jgi:hypothetical protein